MTIPWTWFAIRGTGITAWILLTLVVSYGLLLRTRLLGSAATPPVLLHMHRWLGALGLTFLVLHLAFLLIDPAVRFTLPQLVIPMIAPWQPVAVTFGIVAMWTLIPVAVVGRLRPKLGKKGNAWFKKAHYAAYAAWPLATAHYVLAGTDALSAWSMMLIIGGAGLLVFLFLSRGFVPKPSPVRRAVVKTTVPAEEKKELVSIGE